MKTCRKCDQEHPIDDYTIDTRYKDGRYPWCAACRRAWRQGRKDKQRQLHADWRDRNREHVRMQGRDYYRNNADARERNRSAGRIRDRHRWHADQEYRDKKNAQKLRAYYENPAQRNRHLTSVKINVHRRRALIRALIEHFTAAEWRDLCARYGDRCLSCGHTGKLTPDHVVPLSRGGSNTIDNIQPLCLRCNLRKHARTIDYRPGWGA